MKEYIVDFEAWEVTEPDFNGGITSVHLAYFSSQIEANKFVNQSKWPRYANKITVNKNWVVLDSVSEYESLVTKVKKENALNKLTAEERKLLGF